MDAKVIAASDALRGAVGNLLSVYAGRVRDHELEIADTDQVYRLAMDVARCAKMAGTAIREADQRDRAESAKGAG
jgi:hypothetical protein